LFERHPVAQSPSQIQPAYIDINVRNILHVCLVASPSSFSIVSFGEEQRLQASHTSFQWLSSPTGRIDGDIAEHELLDM
jgi:hypothetical protein